VSGWYVVENRGPSGRRLAGPFEDPSADEASEAVHRLYAELGAGCCDLVIEFREDEG
jgi:hypothetical protein